MAAQPNRLLVAHAVNRTYVYEVLEPGSGTAASGVLPRRKLRRS
jgi:hypothetical protein